MVSMVSSLTPGGGLGLRSVEAEDLMAAFALAWVENQQRGEIRIVRMQNSS